MATTGWLAAVGLVRGLLFPDAEALAFTRFSEVRPCKYRGFALAISATMLSLQQTLGGRPHEVQKDVVGIENITHHIFQGEAIVLLLITPSISAAMSSEQGNIQVAAAQQHQNCRQPSVGQIAATRTREAM